MRTINRRWSRLVTAAAATLLLASGAADAAAQLADVQGLPVLTLRGTPHEMGFQHGQALAAGIKEGIEQFILRYRCHGIRARYEQMVKRVQSEVLFPDRIHEELVGMLAGMQASGVDLALAPLKRAVGLQDLELLNTIDHWGLFGCSGFAAWGRCTKDGQLLVARNFDFDVDAAEHAIARLGLVLAFEPKEGKRFVSFAFPGLIGVATGVNEEGVGTFLHVANGSFGGGDEGRTLPLMLVSRLIVEECDPPAAAPRARELLKEAHIRNAFLFRIVTPGGDAPPASIFEIDSRGFEEQPLPDEKKGELPLLITTNHYVHRTGLFPAIPDSKIRFCNLEEDTQKWLAEGDHRLDEAEAWQALGDVNQEGGIVTLHSLVLKPATLEMQVAFSALVPDSKRPIGAARRPPAHVRFADFFPKP